MYRHIALVLFVGFLIAADAPTSPDYKALQGTWNMVGMQIGGRVIDDKEVKEAKVTVTIKGEDMVTKADGKPFSDNTYKIDSSKKSKEITVSIKEGGKVFIRNGIYSLEGDTLKICLAGPGKPAPKEFKTNKDTVEELNVLKRAK